jgi:hypothetical protein
MRTPHQQIVDAVAALVPGALFALSGDSTSGLQWLDPRPRPTDAQIATAIAALPPAPVYVAASTLLGRLSLAEYTGIRQAAAAQLAAGNGQLEQWLDLARTSVAGIDLTDPATIAAKAALVSAKLLTQARADAIFVA